MKTFFDCVPCFVRQALDAARMATDNEEVQEKILRETMRVGAGLSFSQTPPEMGREVHVLVRNLTGNADPYINVKREFNGKALALLPEMKKHMRQARDRLDVAARLAIAGNIIDFGVTAHVGDFSLEKIIEDSLARAYAVGHLEELRQALAGAKKILYLADNAGEIVFDQLLLEEIGFGRVTAAVKGEPIINDATMADAEETGLTKLVRVIDNGADYPGTVLRKCSASFQQEFAAADLVIAKGQGNYETLSEEKSRRIFFLLKAKCPSIARDLGCEIGGIVIKDNARV
jgi:uncharacterized protein with ATP-grasp and redox domains